jgi:3-hydroxymyristoyl/3-hydroxydecanoyl-(acyl carrier protein) dehydratase
MSTEPSRRLPEVTEPLLVEVKIADHSVEMSLAIPQELIYFRGHFPALAVLPGVVQIDWVMLYGRRYLKIGEATARTLQVKFRKIIRPRDYLTLTIVHQPARAQIQFTYADMAGTLSSGRIGLETP